MLTFRVNDMTCGHCVAAITRAVKEAEPAAQVEIDLSRHLVKIDKASDAAGVEEAIREAGYTPVAA